MALVLADVGAAAFLKAMFKDEWPAGGKDLTVKLFTNDYTPLDSSTALSFTEASGGGYASKSLARASWVQSQAAGIEQVAFPQQTWTFSGALDGAASIYGYYIVDADGVLRFAERFGSAYTPAVNGDQLKAAPAFQMSKGTPA